jgi:hypothetical protein
MRNIKLRERRLPLLEALPKHAMVTPQHDNEIYPSLREDATGVPVEDYPSLSNQGLELVENLSGGQ